MTIDSTRILVLVVLFCSALFLPLFPLSASAKTDLTVEVRGLKEPFEKNVLQFLDINRMKDDKDLTVRGIKRLHKQAPQEIRDALQPYGYYAPDIKDSLVKNQDTWQATYTVNKGKPLTISKEDIQWFGEGSNLPTFKQSIIDYHKKAGKLLISSEFESAKNTFMNTALSSGYPKAKFIKSEWLVNLDTNSAELTLHMDTGSLYYFGEVTFKQDFLNQELLQKYITIQQGDPYSYDTLLTFQQDLIATNFAKEVTITPRYDESVNQLLPLDILMEPIAPNLFSFGVGYDSDTGIRGSARWEDRLINSYGHHSDVLLKLAETEGIFRAQYSIPVVKPLTDRWTSTASYQYDQTPDTKSTTLDLETAFVRSNLAGTIFYKTFLLLSKEHFTVGNDPSEDTILLSLGETIHFSKIEDSLFPQTGHYFFADVRAGSEALLSDTSYARAHINGTYMFGIGENVRINTRLEVGGAWVDNFTIYPTSLRFFAGGDSSVRGYKYQSLGPKDAQGKGTGGKNIATGSLEFDYRIAKSWVLATFVDTGNAYNDTIDTVYTGAGAGFRWLAPFGSLRIDIAYPVSEDPGINDWRIHIGFGATL